MNISQVAKQVGLSAKQIRDYEKHGLMRPSQRTMSNYREYSAQDIEKLHFIAHARSVGFSLDQIAELLRLQANPSRTSCQVKDLTAVHLAEINEKIANLQRMHVTLQRWHDSCSGDEDSECNILKAIAAESA
ncbi:MULTISPECIES: Cu(I)-responsive transcriptional regulator [unclassified Acinetobacter]|uniref:Cu(I)-responsive transcriptional regulator n=1 Tax=unclassified Acinetobacter TaxID=196816 RepID=UPI0035B8D551